jgi:hypothetical protein
LALGFFSLIEQGHPSDAYIVDSEELIRIVALANLVRNILT